MEDYSNSLVLTRKRKLVKENGGRRNNYAIKTITELSRAMKKLAKWEKQDANFFILRQNVLSLRRAKRK